jgi:hypothetical protein
MYFLNFKELFLIQYLKFSVRYFIYVVDAFQ